MMNHQSAKMEKGLQSYQSSNMRTVFVVELTIVVVRGDGYFFNVEAIRMETVRHETVASANNRRDI